jgi:fluoroacetyl-CoA thioesterase
MSLEAGLTAQAETEVTAEMLASRVGSGEVDGLATPWMVALMEDVSIKAIASGLPSEMTTVGTRLDVTHVAPTPVGMKVTASATLAEVDGRRLVFSVSVADEAGPVGKGVHERFMVDRQRFAERIAARWEAAEQ